jgi:hypothetical protein
MTIRQSIDEQFTKGIPTSKRGCDDLHMAKWLASYGWAAKAQAALKQGRRS